MTPITVCASGMVTGVGLSAPSTCAALRVGIAGFAETQFMFDGDWIQGSAIPWATPSRGRAKLVRMVAAAIQECLVDYGSGNADAVLLLLCVAEPGRPGRFPELDESLLADVGDELRIELDPRSEILAEGRTGGVRALARARELLGGGCPTCVVAGVDTLLVADSLAAYHASRRLCTAENSDGLIPGEAAAALVLVLDGEADSEALHCLGVGFGHEPANVQSEEPLRASGLLAALQDALADAGQTFSDVDYRIADLGGEQYGFKEAALAISRGMHDLKPEFDLWHPADCVGDTGAAAVPLCVGLALAAARKRFAPGPGVLCHFGNDSGERAALVLRYE